MDEIKTVSQHVPDINDKIKEFMKDKYYRLDGNSVYLSNFPIELSIKDFDTFIKLLEMQKPVSLKGIKTPTMPVMYKKKFVGLYYEFHGLGRMHWITKLITRVPYYKLDNCIAELEKNDYIVINGSMMKWRK